MKLEKILKNTKVLSIKRSSWWVGKTWSPNADTYQNLTPNMMLRFVRVEPENGLSKTCDIKRVLQLFQGFKSTDMLESTRIKSSQNYPHF
jgi:hypothetical protein